jgi:L-amino acid N-acyltransferase YncA
MEKDSTTMDMLKKSGKYAYNVFENHNVYKLTNIKPMDYDTKLVRPMRSQDLKEVITLSKKIFKTKAKRWIKASFNSGELAYVAVVDGRIVGFGFAEVCGPMGRLHTLGIDPEFRTKGIGKELHRARLEAMRLMGVSQVIDEIADWNLASIRISTLSGFEKIGRMYVETKRSRRIKKNIVRR